jgi:hypothetical protein
MRTLLGTIGEPYLHIYPAAYLRTTGEVFEASGSHGSDSYIFLKVDWKNNQSTHRKDEAQDRFNKR